MKKFIPFFSLILFCLSAAVFVSCGSDDSSPSNPENSPSNPENKTPATDNNDKKGEESNAVTKADLLGTWTVYNNGAPSTYVFTEDNLTITFNDDEIYNGSYTLENNKLSYNFDEGTKNFNLELAYDKNVMYCKVIVSASESYSGEEEHQTSFAYRQGGTINATAETVQGKWYWQSQAGFVGARAVLILTGNQFDLIITPWGERQTGTFTYENGYIHFTPQNGYTSRYDDDLTDDDNSYTEHMNQENPEATIWKVSGTPGAERYPSYFSNPGEDIMPFIVNGTEAYGTIANLQATYYKKQ